AWPRPKKWPRPSSGWPQNPLPASPDKRFSSMEEVTKDYKRSGGSVASSPPVANHISHRAESRHEILLCAGSIRIRPLIRRLDPVPRLVQRPRRIVVGLQGFAVFRDRPIALPSQIEDLPDRDMTPDFRPPRLSVAAQRITIGINGGLIIP